MGNPAYDALMMFKILLLQVGSGLSDYDVEERIIDSLLFSEYLLLDMESRAPDHSTICRFRTKLARLRIMDKLLRSRISRFFLSKLKFFTPCKYLVYGEMNATLRPSPTTFSWKDLVCIYNLLYLCNRKRETNRLSKES